MQRYIHPLFCCIERKVYKDPKSVRVNGGRVLSVLIEIKREFEGCSSVTGMRLE